MEDRTPDTPETTPNPHRGEPLPPPQEGQRPEADSDIVRPEEEEPNGPLEGLLHAAATEVKAKTHAPEEASEADIEAMRLGVEDEGIESSQIMGLVIATIAAIAALVLFIVFLFYIPTVDSSRSDAADVPSDRYEELRESRAEALSLIGQYATNPSDSSRYLIPVEAAMERIVSQYGLREGVAQEAAADPVSRTDFNLSWITVTPPAATERQAMAAGLRELPSVEASLAPDVEAASGTDTADGEAAQTASPEEPPAGEE